MKIGFFGDSALENANLIYNLCTRGSINIMKLKNSIIIIKIY